MPTLSSYEQQSAQGGGAPQQKPQQSSPQDSLNTILQQYQGNPSQPTDGTCPACGQAAPAAAPDAASVGAAAI